jgi:transglutaminase-like putative cysteine protease
MKINITHTTRLDYTADVVEGVMDVRLGPRSDRHQRWDRFELRANPTASVRRYTDGFGNAAHLITIARPHRFIEVVSRSEIETFLADPFVLPPVAPPPLGPSDRADYLSPSPLVEPHPDLAGIAAPHGPATPADTFDAVRALMDYVYSHFTYEQHVTSVATTVPDVLACRTGVCQDFAQVLIGLCRAVDIPARYVSGYIVVAGQYQAQRSGGQSQRQSQSQSQSQSGEPGPSRGAGASHAWVEAFTPTHGWRGFDPTNNLVATANHVKMAIGRDYSDVAPTRGTFRGAAEERLAVEVITARLD